MFLWWVLLAVLPFGTLFNSIHFFRLAKKSSLTSVKKYYFWIAVFMLAISVCGVIDVWYAWYQRILGNRGVDPLPHLATEGGTYFFLITTFLMLSFFALTRTVEKYIKQSKKIPLSYIMLCCFLISLLAYITPPDTTDLLAPIIYGTYFPFTLVILYWGVYYLILAKRSEGVLKKRANLIAFGLGTLFLGIAGGIVLRDFDLLIEFTGYLFPIVFVIVANIGVPLLYMGFKQD